VSVNNQHSGFCRQLDLKKCEFTGVLKAIFLAAVMLVSARDASAIDFPDVIADPLLARPPKLGTGIMLPDDEMPLSCPVSKDFTSSLALGEAVDIALCNNPQIKMAWAAIKVQSAAVGEARAAYLPTVSATVNRLRNHTTYPGSDVASTSMEGTTIYGSLSWRLFDFGGRAANRISANKLLDAALTSHDATLQKTLAAIVQTYFEAMTAQAALTAKNETVRIAEATLNAVNKREAKGVSSQNDTLQANTALAREALGQQRAQGDYRKALAVLVQLMGMPANTQVILPDVTDDLSADAAKSLDLWLADAEQRHPAILAARAQRDAAGDRVVVARSEGLPTVDFTANYYENGYPGQGLQSTKTQVSTVGFTLTIPVFDGFSRTYKIRGAQAQVEQREAELQDTEHQVLAEIVKAHADAVSSLGNLQSSDALLKAAQASLASSMRRYDKGAADVLELLNAQSALAEARQERVRCIDEWRSARLRLMANAGALDRASIPANVH